MRSFPGCPPAARSHARPGPPIALFLLPIVFTLASCGDESPTGEYANLRVTTSSLPEAIESVAYSQTLEAAGGDGSYMWSVSTGSLPAGLSLGTATGAISGTPTEPGTEDFTVEVASGDGQTARRSLSIQVQSGVLEVTTSSLPDGTEGVAYSHTLQATGGNGTYGWSLSSGSLPPGLALGASTGKISGTPTDRGTRDFTVEVVSGGQTVRQPLSLQVRAQVAIIFQTTRDGNLEIYGMGEDGADPVNLTKNPELDSGAAWSPDGSKILFTSLRDGNSEVYVMSARGSAVENLTRHPASDAGPAWSPDGSEIAFQTTRDPSTEIYAMNADGSNPVNLTKTPTASEGELSWSPDGSKIAFSTNRDMNWEIYVMDADGSNPVNLTKHGASDTRPVWSPDGSKIAFSTDRDGNWDIYVMDPDGSSPVNLTNHPARDDEPVWSPDGSKIAFRTGRDGNSEIYVTTPGGAGPINLTDHPATDAGLAWSPDGSKVAFGTDRDGTFFDIYVMGSDGSSPVALTTDPAHDVPSDWRQIP